MTHQTHLHPMPDRVRLMFMNNFYTSHVLTRQLARLSDRDCRVFDPVRFTNIDGLNRTALREAIESLRYAQPGDWRLVKVYQEDVNANSVAAGAERTGFGFFKDPFVVSFYTNDLADTPRLGIHTPNGHTILCV